MFILIFLNKKKEKKRLRCTLKGLILAAGKGKRMEPLTLKIPKPLLMLPGGTLIKHQIKALMDADINEIIIVTHHLATKIKQYLEKHLRSHDVKIRIIYQKTLQGTVSAILTAEPFLEEKFLVLHCDNFFSCRLKPLIEDFEPPIITLYVEKTDNKKHDTKTRIVRVQLDGKGFITKIFASPTKTQKKDFEKGFVTTGAYIISKKTIPYLKKTPLTPQGERDISDTLKILIKEKKPVRGTILNNFGWRENINTIDDLLTTNRKILERWKLQEFIIPNQGTFIKEGITQSFQENTTVIGPSWIGENVRFKNSIIGPFCTIGAHAQVAHSEVKHAIIHPTTTLREVKAFHAYLF